MKFIIGLIIVAAGACIVIWERKIYENFGPFSYAEEKLGHGGSHLFYKLVGVAVSIIGFMYMTGLTGKLINATIGRMIG